MDTAAVRVEVQYEALHLERPPKIRLFLDIMLENRRDTPRWVLLPDRLPHPPGAYAVRALEAYLLGAPRRVVVGHLIGTHGCQALLLPARASIRLRRFPVLFWGYEIPDQVAIEVTSAIEVAIGGAPATAWFGKDPAGCCPGDGREGFPRSDAGADVDASALAEQAEVQYSRRAAGDEDMPVALTDMERIQVHVEIPS